MFIFVFTELVGRDLLNALPESFGVFLEGVSRGKAVIWLLARTAFEIKKVLKKKNKNFILSLCV